MYSISNKKSHYITYLHLKRIYQLKMSIMMTSISMMIVMMMVNEYFDGNNDDYDDKCGDSDGDDYDE